MFLYYTMITIITVCAMAIIIAAALSYRMLPQKSKEGFLIAFTSIIVAVLADWVSMYSDMKGSGFRNLNIIAVIITFSIAPVIPIVLASAITNLKHIKLYWCLLFLHFIIECYSGLYGFIYYIDANGVYFRGDYYWFYLLVYVLAIIVMFYSIYRLSNRYQNQSNYILILILIFLLFGTSIQIVYDEVYTIWLCVGVTALLLYNYYATLFNQMDTQTYLLNRRCYEAHVDHIKMDSVFVFLHFESEKEEVEVGISHSSDRVLSLIGKMIQNVYGYYGTCFYIGRNKFCIVLDKKIEMVGVLNLAFAEGYQIEQKKDLELPEVYVGIGNLNIEQGNIQEAIEEAEQMIKILKNKNGV